MDSEESASIAQSLAIQRSVRVNLGAVCGIIAFMTPGGGALTQRLSNMRDGEMGTQLGIDPDRASASQALFMMNERGNRAKGEGRDGVTRRVLVSLHFALTLAS